VNASQSAGVTTSAGGRFRKAQNRERSIHSGIGELAEDAELIVSELATNALKASQSLQEVRPFALCLRSDCERLIIEVWDHSLREPRSALAGGDAEGGRGLLVVESLSTRWGYQRTGYSTKVVWAELNNPPM
jgi:anti-sigma regulatory factor (Ser/Thr protein kinase)